MAEYNSCASLIADKEKVVELQNNFESASDPLQDMLNMQERLQTTLAEKLPERNMRPAEINTKGELVQWIDQNFDSIMDEMRELKTSIGGMSRGEKAASAVWKRWKSDHVEMTSERIDDMSEEDRLEMMFEFTDIWHFVMNLALGLGFTSEDLYVLYMLKNYENIRRYESNY